MSDNLSLSDTSNIPRGLVPVATAERSLDELANIVKRAQDYAGHEKSERTIRAYASDWRDFLNSTQQRSLVPLPAMDDTVALYLAGLAGRPPLERHGRAVPFVRVVSFVTTPRRWWGL